MHDIFLPRKEKNCIGFLGFKNCIVRKELKGEDESFALPPFSGRARLNWRQPLHCIWVGNRNQSLLAVAHAHACPFVLTGLAVADETQ